MSNSQRDEQEPDEAQRSEAQPSKKEIGRDELTDVTGGANASISPLPPPSGNG